MKFKPNDVVNGIKMTSTHVLLFERIEYLSAKTGSCWANNRSLAEMMGKSMSRVSHIITDLRRAGLVAVKLMYSPKIPKMVLARYVRILDKPVTCPIATNREEQTRIVKTNNNDVEKETETSHHAAVGQKAAALGISPVLYATKVLEYGRKLAGNKPCSFEEMKELGVNYVEEKLALLNSSLSVKNPIAYFFAALKNNWQLGKKAKKDIGKPARNRAVVYAVDVKPIVSAKKAIDSDFMRNLSKTNPALAARLAKRLSK